MVSEILIRFPETYLVFVVPLIGIGIVVLILLAYFGVRIYKWDLNLVYGNIFKKLEEIVIEIESSLGISLGLIGGMVVGAILGKNKESQAKAAGNIL